MAPRAQTGFTYIAVLFLVALMGVTLAAAGEVWRTASMRDKEAQLLFVGHAYRRAIQGYAANAPRGASQYPRELSDLLRDPRVPFVRRYLRSLYRDPITNSADWGIVRSADGGIAGVYSTSDARPVKSANFDKADAAFADKSRYSDWKFAVDTP